jgi:hypothetical protein
MRGMRRLAVAAIAAPRRGKLARTGLYQSSMSFGSKSWKRRSIFPPLRVAD